MALYNLTPGHYRYEIDAPGKVLSNVVVTLAVDIHPFSPVTVTVNVPAVFTVIEAVVAPVDQRTFRYQLLLSVVDGVVQFNARPLSLRWMRLVKYCPMLSLHLL